MKTTRSMVVGIALITIGFALAAAGALMLLKPNRFKSTAVVKTPPHVTSPGVYDPYFLMVEFEVCQSHAVLTNVGVALSLNERWGNKYNRGQRLSDSEVEKMIKSRLELRIIRNTDLLEITTIDDDPQEAADLANTIVRSYSEFRRKEIVSRAAEAEQVGMIADRMVPITNYGVPGIHPVRPNRYVAGAMLGGGLLLMIMGIGCFNGRGRRLKG